MTEESPDRHLPNLFIRHFFIAVEGQIGIYSLQMMLRQAGLERYVDHFPGLDNPAEMLSSEYAAFQQAIRLYFGKGARSILTRIGQRFFQGMVKEAGFLNRLRLLAIRRLPPSTRRRKILDFLAGQMCDPGCKISIQPGDFDLVVMVAASDATCGQSSIEPICWVTLGMIQEALLWATGEEPEVEEIHCRACGDQDCAFKVSWLNNEWKIPNSR